MRGGSADSPCTNINISMTDDFPDSKIISITDIIEQKVRKEKQLEEYEELLSDLQRKKFWLEKEIQILQKIFLKKITVKILSESTKFRKNIK